MHLEEQEMEEYALGLLPPLSVQQFEMHLLVCDRCQERLAEMDVFLVAMRAACADFRAGRQDASRNVSSTINQSAPAEVQPHAAGPPC